MQMWWCRRSYACGPYGGFPRLQLASCMPTDTQIIAWLEVYECLSTNMIISGDINPPAPLHAPPRRRTETSSCGPKTTPPASRCWSSALASWSARCGTLEPSRAKCLHTNSCRQSCLPAASASSLTSKATLWTFCPGSSTACTQTWLPASGRGGRVRWQRRACCYFATC